MQFTAATAALILAFTAVQAVPVPQANKMGTGIYEIGTGVDDSTGYYVENLGGDFENAAEKSTALTAIGGPDSNNGANNAGAQQGQQVPAKVKRQANKMGTGIYEIGTGVDDSTGYYTENLGGDFENAAEKSTALTAIGGPDSNNGANNAGAQQGQMVPAKDKRQLGNDAAGVDSIMQGVDAGAGQGLQNGMQNAGSLIEKEGFAAGNLVPSGKKHRRQLGNDAAGVDSIMQGVDAGFGQGLQNGMQNGGSLIEKEGFRAGDLVPSGKKDRR